MEGDHWGAASALRRAGRGRGGHGGYMVSMQSNMSSTMSIESTASLRDFGINRRTSADDFSGTGSMPLSGPVLRRVSEMTAGESGLSSRSSISTRGYRGSVAEVDDLWAENNELIQRVEFLERTLMEYERDAGITMLPGPSIASAGRGWR